MFVYGLNCVCFLFKYTYVSKMKCNVILLYRVTDLINLIIDYNCIYKNKNVYRFMLMICFKGNAEYRIWYGKVECFF